MHFVKTRWYERIMPPYIPRHRELVYVSGVAEIAGGLATMHPATRRAGSLWSIATLVAVFPANVKMAYDWRHKPASLKAAAYGRLPVQVPLVLWALKVGRSARASG